jgi:hypothetical protein
MAAVAEGAPHEDDGLGGAGAPLSSTSRPKEIQKRHFADTQDTRASVETWHQAVLGLVVGAPGVPQHVVHLLLLSATAGAAEWAGAAGGAQRRPGRVPFGGRNRPGGTEVRDRGTVRKQREVDGAQSGEVPLTGALQTALECRGRRGCGESPRNVL